MSNLINQVTPLTRGIIWLAKDESEEINPLYQQIDYLLDGLLTSNLKTSHNVSSRVIVGKNFDKSFFVMIIREPKRQELESFLSLFQKELLPEDDIIVIDESQSFERIKSDLKKISGHIRFLQ